ncbi:MAG: hypothetical protein ABSH08_18655, partial [Tepidisphaeraceae bacterium]
MEAVKGRITSKLLKSEDTVRENARKRRRIGLLGMAAASAVCLQMNHRALGATETWTAASGNWSTASNWNSGSGPVPGAGDTVDITNADGTSRTIAYNYSGPAITLGYLTIDNDGAGTNTLSMTSAGTALSAAIEELGNSNSSVFPGWGVLIQSAGSNTLTNSLYLGYGAADAGFYTLSGTGSLTTTYNGFLKPGNEYLGWSGTGSFNQTGGSNTVGGALWLGFSTGSSGTYNLSGTGSLSATGNAIVGGSDSGGGGTGLLTVSSAAQLTVAGTLTVNSSGRVNINGGTSKVGSLSIATGGVVNVNDALFINYGSGADPIATIASYIESGYNGGHWNGPGIISTTAQTPTNGLRYAVGYADGKDGKVSGLSSGQIEVKYTLLADANLDSLVNAADFTILAANFNQLATGWDQGDFNYDGIVNAADFTDLAANFNQAASGAASAGDVAALDAFAAANGLLADVPEPASLALF